jgi:hypothetical protein
MIVEFTDREIAEAVAGKFITKAILLPNPRSRYIEMGTASRGTTLAVLRLGDRLLEEP